MVLVTLLLAAQAEPPADRVPIPAGSFVQGGEQHPDAHPRRVTLSAYAIDRTEVSIAAFEAFTAAGGYRNRGLWSEDGWTWVQAHPEGASAELRAAGRAGDHPVVAVTWFEADAYCRWRGGSLPTEAQWEHAACGDGGQPYPWGDDPHKNEEAIEGVYHAPKDEVVTKPVGWSKPGTEGPFGLLGVSGNVWEWTADWYRADTYLVEGDATDPTGPSTGTWKTLRGGSFLNLLSYRTCAHREPARPDRVAFTTGFRCAYPSP